MDSKTSTQDAVNDARDRLRAVRANRAATRDPGIIPGGIRDRALKAIQKRRQLTRPKTQTNEAAE